MPAPWTPPKNGGVCERPPPKTCGKPGCWTCGKPTCGTCWKPPCWKPPCCAPAPSPKAAAPTFGAFGLMPDVCERPCTDRRTWFSASMVWLMRSLRSCSLRMSTFAVSINVAPCFKFLPVAGNCREVCARRAKVQRRCHTRRMPMPQGSGASRPWYHGGGGAMDRAISCGRCVEWRTFLAARLGAWPAAVAWRRCGGGAIFFQGREGNGGEPEARGQERGEDRHRECQGPAVPEPVEPLAELDPEHVRLAAVELQLAQVLLGVVGVVSRGICRRRAGVRIDHDRGGQAADQDRPADRAQHRRAVEPLPSHDARPLPRPRERHEPRAASATRYRTWGLPAAR